MREKRRQKRFSVDFMDIRGNILFSTDVQLLNISHGGVSFSINKNLNVGGMYVLRLESKDKTLYLRGTIVWAKVNEMHQEHDNIIPNCTVGMKFTKVRAHQQRGIQSLIQDNVVDYQMDMVGFTWSFKNSSRFLPLPDIE
jgi:hypothetical protein